jgi:hypothetical protein
MCIEVVLNKNEIYIAAIVGIRRNITSMDSSSCNEVKNKDFGWHTDIEAACAELALAKGLGVYWDYSVNTFKKPDVGYRQCRHAQELNKKLIVRPKDKELDNFWLVLGTTPKFKIVGWIFGSEAKTEKYAYKGFNGMPDCWMVPQDALTPPEYRDPGQEG